MENLTPEEGNPSGQKRTRQKSPIADLPAGVSVHKLGNGSFRVRLGQKFTRNRAFRKDFTKLQAARDWIAEQIRDCVALRQMELTPEQVANAKTAFARLGEIPLLEAVEFYINSGQGHVQSAKINGAINLYLAKHKKSGSDESYVKAQKISLKLLQSTWKDRKSPEGAPETAKKQPAKRQEDQPEYDYPLGDFTPKKIDSWFTRIKAEKAWGDLNTLNYVRDLKMFFRFCVRHKLLASNPMDDPVFDWGKPLRKKIKQNHEVAIYNIKEVEKLLLAALNDDDQDMLIWFAIAFFSGIRIDEMSRLRWALFQWDEKIISLSKVDVAKGGDPRHIKFSGAFEAWLTKVPSVKTRVGPIVDLTNWRHRLDKFHARAGVAKKRNALRHTFASYHYVQFGDADATRKILGQKTADVLFANYVHLVRQKEAAAFWNLRPPSGKKVQKRANTG